MTDIYGILGFPVGHSRSPAMHNSAFAALGIDAMYVPFAVPPERLRAAIASIRPLNLRGLNVTLPHKSTVMALLDRVEPDALVIGAVNTLFFEQDKLVGMNTDAPGLTRSLVEAGLQLDGARVTVVGAGGAARASIVGLARAGASRISVTARRTHEAEKLVSELAAAVSPVALHVESWERMAHRRCLGETDLLIQATSATLDDGPAAAALAEALPLDALPDTAAVVDLVYKPRLTAVLKAAKDLEKRTVDGLGMLLHQGAIAFEKWTGQTAPVTVMRAALDAP
jgi:shikimate dehydrogenase